MQFGYVPVILTSLDEIAKRFSVSKATVRDWAKEGAPIVITGSERNRRYTTELCDLYAWYKAHFLENEQIA